MSFKTIIRQEFVPKTKTFKIVTVDDVVEYRLEDLLPADQQAELIPHLDENTDFTITAADFIVRVDNRIIFYDRNTMEVTEQYVSRFLDEPTMKMSSEMVVATDSNIIYARDLYYIDEEVDGPYATSWDELYKNRMRARCYPNHEVIALNFIIHQATPVNLNNYLRVLIESNSLTVLIGIKRLNAADDDEDVWFEIINHRPRATYFMRNNIFYSYEDDRINVVETRPFTNSDWRELRANSVLVSLI